MTARLLLGKPVADGVLSDVRRRVAAFQQGAGRPPSLVIVRIGDDADAAVYTRSLLRACRGAGLTGQEALLPGVREEDALAVVRRWANDPDVDAVLVQTPLPPGVRRAALTDAIPPVKDVDGLGAENAGLLAQGRPRHTPATAQALLLLAQASGITLGGARAVVVGRSAVVGMPAALLLIQANATVTICHRATAQLAAETRRAELLVVAAGQPGAIRGEMVAPGAVVLDAGTTATENGLRGDVETESVAAVASVLTPTPGGVGPVTTAVLLRGVVAAAEERAE